MNLVLWTIVALLVVAAGVLQLVGVRALEGAGVQPSRATVMLRVFNMTVVVGILGFALWQWSVR